MNLPTLEVDLAPIETVLLAHPHPGMNGQKEVRQELRKTPPDGRPQADLFRVGQESDASSAFRLAANAGRRIPVDLLVVDAHSERSKRM